MKPKWKSKWNLNSFSKNKNNQGASNQVGATDRGSPGHNFGYALVTRVSYSLPKLHQSLTPRDLTWKPTPLTLYSLPNLLNSHPLFLSLPQLSLLSLFSGFLLIYSVLRLFDCLAFFLADALSASSLAFLRIIDDFLVNLIFSCFFWGRFWRCADKPTRVYLILRLDFRFLFASLEMFDWDDEEVILLLFILFLINTIYFF